MKAQCSSQSYLFPAEISRQIVARFDGGTITSDAGWLLLQQVERQTGVLRQFAACFTDRRNSHLIEHTMTELISQRI